MAKGKGRPSKLNNTFLEVAEKILNKKDLMLLTDKEFLFLINEELEDEYKVSDRTFEYWKAGEFGNNEELGKNFLRLIQNSLLKQKEDLYRQFRNDSQWTRWAWIIERKFTEWNIKHQHDVTSNGNELKQITGFKID